MHPLVILSNVINMCLSETNQLVAVPLILITQKSEQRDSNGFRKSTVKDSKSLLNAQKRIDIIGTKETEKTASV